MKKTIAVFAMLSASFLASANPVGIVTDSGTAFSKEGNRFTDLQSGIEFFGTHAGGGLPIDDFTIIDDRTILSGGYQYSLLGSSMMIDLVNNFFGAVIVHNNLSPNTYNTPITSDVLESDLLAFINMVGGYGASAYVVGGGRAPNLAGYTPTQLFSLMTLNDSTADENDLSSSVAFNYQYLTPQGEFSHYVRGFHMSFAPAHTPDISAHSISLDPNGAFLFYRDVNTVQSASASDVSAPFALAGLSLIGLGLAGLRKRK